jgi:sensor histidine kinase YesM
MLNFFSNRQLLHWLAFFALWTLLGLFFATQSYIGYAYISKSQASWTQAISLALSEWYLWGLLSVLILALAKRFQIESGRWKSSLLIHLTISILFAIAHLAFYSCLVPFIGWSQTSRFSPLQLFQSFFIFKFHPNVLTYWAIVGVSHALDYYRQYQERKLRAAHLETQLAQAQLQALKMQLHPHFLFNALNAIQALIHEDPEAADRMIARLSDLLRISLESEHHQEVTLQQELEFLHRYLEIEQIRFQDRLTVEFNIAPDTLAERLPHLILQPVVENAIRHGVALRSTQGKIEISAKKEKDFLKIRVRDNGPGLPKDTKILLAGGVGLVNTRSRLRQMYGDAQDMQLENSDDGGVIATLAIPLQRDHS